MIKRLLILPLILTTAFLFNCEDRNKTPKDDKVNDAASDAGIPGIVASVDHSGVRTGDLIKLRLKYNLPEGSTFSENDLAGLDGLTIVGKKTGKQEIIFSLLIDKTASFDIGPISLSFKDKNGVLNIIKSGILHIDVSSNLDKSPKEEETGLKPIMDIIATYPLWLKLLPWMSVILILCALGIAIYYWKKRKRKEAELLMSLRPPHVIAREEIEKLVALNLTDKGRHKEFYFRFSEILRQYLERLRGFPAAEFTTEEIARKVGAGPHAFHAEDRKLVDILRDADLVKFADFIPGKAKNEDDVRAALDYINATTPINLTP